VLSGVVGDDLIQLGPIGVSTAQVAFNVLLADPLDDGPPTNTPHVDVHEGNVTSGTGSKGCVLATLFPMPGFCFRQQHAKMIDERTCGRRPW